jgi:hypothetical protein
MSAKRRHRPVGVEDFLRRNLRHNYPRHFRVEPANAVWANDKIGRIENMSHDEIQHCAVDLRSFRLHYIKNEFRQAIAALMHDSECGVITIGNRFNANFAFKRGIGVIQYRVDRMRRVAIPTGYGFAEMFAPLYEQSRIQTSLLEGTSPAVNFFAKQVLPTVKAMQTNNSFEVASIVRKSSPLLSAETLKVDGARQLGLAKAATESLASLFGPDRSPTFRQVLENVATSGLFEVPDALEPFGSPDAPSLNRGDPDERQTDEAAAWREMLKTSFSQIEAYDQYVSRESPFGTHQGVKGPRVCAQEAPTEKNRRVRYGTYRSVSVT